MPRRNPSRLDPLVVHALPKAPTFAGRETEIRFLQRFWHEGSGVVSLIGPGGAGKTALAQRFLAWALEEDPPDGLLVWSFYDEPDANAFLQAAYRYFTHGRTADAKGAGWFHLLGDALATGDNFLLVLDGLERVQRASTSVQGIFGETEDPLLRGFLTRVAAGLGNTKVAITTRFPVADIERWRNHGYSEVHVAELPRDDARKLLRIHGSRGDDRALDRLLSAFGSHALTLDLLGGATELFFGGDASAVPEPAVLPPGEDLQYRRLASVLSLYQQHLPPRELALLTRLCIFRFGVDLQGLEAVFLQKAGETVSGPLEGCRSADLAAFLERLVACHLVLHDDHSRFTIHPAVRDYFYHLLGERAEVHEAVGKHLSSLTGRPGVGLPSDKRTLDMLEELVYHLLQAGAVEEATEIYYHRLGGDHHLNAKMGEYARTHRILSSFPECPDGSAMYHCLRAFGRFAEALEWRPQNRYIRLANGHLQVLASDPNQTTQRIASFLRGESASVPARSPDMPVPAAMLHLLRGDVPEARRVAEAEMDVSMFGDDVARQQLVLAEAERRAGDLDACQAHLDTASTWILQSGSQEHLCLHHLIRARLGADRRDAGMVRSALREGLHIAEECQFRLWEIDLLSERTRQLLDEGDAPGAEAAARVAHELASEESCGYAWGDARALRLLGEALCRQQRHPDARPVLQEAAARLRALGDPEAIEAERAAAGALQQGGGPSQ